jgi:hypothetical protein
LRGVDRPAEVKIHPPQTLPLKRRLGAGDSAKVVRVSAGGRPESVEVHKVVTLHVKMILFCFFLPLVFVTEVRILSLFTAFSLCVRYIVVTMEAVHCVLFVF